MAARTLSAPPGSPPLQLALANITAGTALASWQPPAKPNGVVYKYLLELAYEDSQGRTQPAQRFQVFNTTEAAIGNLLSYTRYRTNVGTISSRTSTVNTYLKFLLKFGAGSGSIPLTNGFGYRRPKNMGIRRIRIPNTDPYFRLQSSQCRNAKIE